MIKNKVSVIIPTKDRYSELLICLESIKNQTIQPKEIIIVDSSLNDDVKKAIKKYKSLPIKYFRSNPGSGYQRNRGAEKSKGDIILFSDDDTIWEKECLEKILEVFEKFPNRIGVVSGSPILERENFLRKLSLKFYYFISKIFLLAKPGNGRFKISGRPEVYPRDIKEIKRCEFIYGFYMAMKKELWKKFPWDENFKIYGWNEEDDLAYNITKNGYKNYYTPFARVRHTMPNRKNRYKNVNASQKKIEYHYYLFKKNMPQDLKHKLAFWWSVLGTIIQDSLLCILNGKIDGVKGLLKGILNIRKQKFA